MAAVLRRLSSVWLVLFCLVGAALVVQLFYSGDALASHGARNPAEQDAVNLCYGPGQHDSRGAIWITNQSGYYSYGVIVNDGQTSVRVDINGSVYSCLHYTAGPVRATHVRPAAPNANRLSHLSGTSFSRGSIPNHAERFSSQGSSLAATLDVSGIATHNATSSDTQTIYVGIYRCFWQNGVQGECYSQTIPIKVTRKKREPAHWGNMQATSTVNRATARPGQAVRWTHKVWDNGAKGNARTDTITGAVNWAAGTTGPVPASQRAGAASYPTKAQVSNTAVGYSKKFDKGAANGKTLSYTFTIPSTARAGPASNVRNAVRAAATGKMRIIFTSIGSPRILTQRSLDYCRNAENARTAFRRARLLGYQALNGEASAFVHR